MKTETNNNDKNNKVMCFQGDRLHTATAISTASFCMSSFMSALLMTILRPAGPMEEDFRSSGLDLAAGAPGLLFLDSSAFILRKQGGQQLAQINRSMNLLFLGNVAEKQ